MPAHASIALALVIPCVLNSVGTFREVPVGSFRDIPVTGGIRQEHSYASGTHRHELHKTIHLRGAIDIIRAHPRESVFGIQLQVT